ncbi:MAG: hypothetical protein Q4C70_08380 [Planctomycetia bacterium]|nr:hypothetical protein [Planctomycetia bacterium]
MKKMLLPVLLAFVCLAGMAQNAGAEEELSLTLTPAYGAHWKRSLPWTQEERVMVHCDFAGLDMDQKKNSHFKFKFTILKDDEVVVSNSSQVDCFNGQFSFFIQGPILNAGNYSLEVVIEDILSGKKTTKIMPIEVQEKKDLRLLNITLIDGVSRSPIRPLCFTEQSLACACQCSKAVQYGDEVTVTVSDKETSEIINTYDVEDTRFPFFFSFQLNKPGKRILLIKAVDKTQNLEVEYELPIVVVDSREVME